MTIFFIIINLILNIIALMAIIILFLRQSKLYKLEEKQKKTIKEMEELLSSFVLEMKEDNEHLIKSLETIKNEKSVSILDTQKNASPIVRPMEKTTEQDVKEKDIDFSNRFGKTVGNYAVKAYQQQSKKEKAEIQDPLKESEILIEKHTSNLVHQDSLGDQIGKMKNQGYSIEDIAKKLGKGKTEIGLLLKFQESHQE